MVGNLKTELLERSNNGLDFFKIYFGDKLHKATPTRFKNVKNPFYDDKNKSFSIYQDDKGRWFYKDYGDMDYQGDCFNFYAHVHNLDVKKNFADILIKMKQALEDGITNTFIIKAPSKNEDNNAKAVSAVKLNEIAFTQQALQFWKQYNITEEILRINNVCQVIGYHEYYNNDDDRYITLNQNLVFAYKSAGVYKFYSPNPKRFWSIGKKTSEYRFGENFQSESNKMFLVGGEKDVMTLHALGYQAVCLSSEMVSPSSRFAKDLFEENIEVIILYDNDEAGRKGAQKISKMFSWEIADLSLILDNDSIIKVKDVSDYVKLGYPLKDLRDFLNQSVEQDSHVTEEIGVSEFLDVEVEPKEQFSNYVPEFVYKNLPRSISEAVERFEGIRKDMVLLGTIGVLSNIINVRGYYGSKVVYPNLFIFITAPASAGKGDLYWAKKLTESIDARFRQEYNNKNEEYKLDKKNIEKPSRKRLFISGNASHSAIIKQLSINEGSAIMMETEADTLNNALENDWGNFSDLLRKAFEFEAIATSRVNDEDTYEVEKPRLSVLLSGTKDQLFKLVPSAENGLFSRFIFVEFPIVEEWLSPFRQKEDLSNRFSKLSNNFLQYYSVTRANNICFRFTEEQQDRFDIFYESKQEEYKVMLGIESLSSVRRMGSVQYRLAMLLSTLRMLDQMGEVTRDIVCSEEDYNISERLIDWFLKHTEKIFRQLPKKVSNYPELKKEIVILYERLDDEFAFKDAKIIGEDMGIAQSTLEGYIRKLISINLVERYKQGVYMKVKKHTTEN